MASSILLASTDWTPRSRTVDSTHTGGDEGQESLSGQVLSTIILRAVSSGLPDYQHLLGCYRYKKFLGEGACFSVEARRANDYTLIAVKHIKGTYSSNIRSLGAHDNRALQIALRELQILTHPPLRRHPHVIGLLGYGWDTTDFYFAQELAEHDLRGFLKSTPTSWKQKAQFCAEIAAGLAALHCCGILHADVKQENILIVAHSTRQYVSKLSDFSHAAAIHSSDRHFYAGGTTLYAAPECRERAWLGRDAILKTDVFSFGLVCWEIFRSGESYYRSFDKFADLETSAVIRELSTLRRDSILEQALQELKAKIPSAKPKLFAYTQLVLSATLGDTAGSRMSMDDLCRKLVPGQNTESIDNLGQPFLPTAATSYDPIEFARHSYSWKTQVLVFRELQNSYKQADQSPQGSNLAWELAMCYLIGWGTTKDRTRFLDLLGEARFLGSRSAEVLLPRLCLSYKMPVTHHLKNLHLKDSHCVCSDSLPQDVTSRTCLAVRCRHLYARGWLSVTRVLDSPKPLEWTQPIHGLGTTPFHLLCCNGNAERVGNLCRGIETLHLARLLIADDGSGRTPAHCASEGGNLSVLKILDEYGASFKVVDAEGRTCLHWLALFEPDEIREASTFLHQRDPTQIYRSTKFAYDVGLGWEQGGSPLHWAVAAGNIMAVKALLELGANPTLAADWPPVRNDGKWPKSFQHSLFDIMDVATPLDLAARLHLADIYRVLVDSLPIWMRSNPMSHYPMILRHACMAVPRQARRIIHGSGYQEAFNETLDTILGFSPGALQTMNEEVLRLVTMTLSELHQEAYVVDGLLRRLPSEWYAALDNRLGYNAVASALLSLTHDPSDTGYLYLLLEDFGCRNVVGLNPCTPPLPKFSIFHSVVDRDNVAALSLLLDAGADSATKPIHKMYLMLLAIGSGSKDCLKLLLNKGYSVNLVQEEGFTPLHFAANKGMLEEARMLIDHGANLFTRIKDAEGKRIPRKNRTWTLFHSALSNNNPNGFVQSIVASYMKSRIQHRLLQCIDHPSAEHMKFRPLHLASISADLPAVVALVRAGAMPGYCVHCEGDQNFPMGPAEFLRTYIDSDAFAQEEKPEYIKRRLEYISEYLDEMQKAAARERAKFGMALTDAVFGIPIHEDSQRAFLQSMKENGFPSLDDFPDDPEEMDEHYEHEPEDIYAASILSIKRTMRKTPLSKGLHSMANVFDNAAEVQEGKPNTIPGRFSPDGSGDITGAFADFGIPLRDLAEGCRQHARQLEPHNGCKRCQRMSRHRPSFMKEEDEKKGKDEVLFRSSSEDSEADDADEYIPGHSHIMIPGAAAVDAQLAFALEASFAIKSDPDWSDIPEELRMEKMQKIGKKFNRSKNWKFAGYDDFLKSEILDPETNATPSGTTDERPKSKETAPDSRTGQNPSTNLCKDGKQTISLPEEEAEKSSKASEDVEGDHGKPRTPNDLPQKEFVFPFPYSIEDRLEARMNQIYNTLDQELDKNVV